IPLWTVRLHPRTRADRARRPRGGTGGLGVDGVAGLARGRGAHDPPRVAGAGGRVRAGRLGPVPRSTDGRRRVLGVDRSGGRTGDQLPRLARRQPAHDGGAGAGRTVDSGPAGGRPDARPVPVDLLLLGAGPRGVPGSAGVGAVGRNRDGRRRRAGLRQAGAMSPLAWVPAVAVAVLTGHTLVNARRLRRPSPVVSPVDRRVSVLLPVRDEAHRVAACL